MVDTSINTEHKPPTFGANCDWTLAVCGWGFISQAIKAVV